MPRAADEPDSAGERVEPDGEHDDGRDHGAEKESLGECPQPRPQPRQAERRGGSRRDREETGQGGDFEIGEERAQPGGIGEECVPPAQRPALWRQAHEALLAEGERHNRENRNDDEGCEQRRENLGPGAGLRHPTSAKALTGAKRRARPTTTSAMASSVIDAAAASGQSRRSLTNKSISIGIVVFEGPPSRAGVTKKPSDRRKVKIAAVASPRADNGSSTRRKVVRRGAPSSIACP